MSKVKLLSYIYIYILKDIYCQISVLSCSDHFIPFAGVNYELLLVQTLREKGFAYIIKNNQLRNLCDLLKFHASSHLFTLESYFKWLTSAFAG